MKRTISIMIILMIVCLAGCTQPATEAKDTTTPSAQTGPEANPEPAAETQAPAQEAPAEDEAEQPKEYSADVLAVISKGKVKDNYKYRYSSSFLNKNGQYQQRQGFIVSIKGSKIKKEYSDLQKPDVSTSYDAVFLDPDAKTAYAICSLTEAKCGESYMKRYVLSYEDEKLAITPLEVLSMIGYDAYLKGTEVYEDRKAYVLYHTNAQGNKEKLLIDKFYGIPLKQEIYKQEGDEEKKIEENSFVIMTVGGVKDSDVNIGTEYS